MRKSSRIWEWKGTIFMCEDAAQNTKESKRWEEFSGWEINTGSYLRSRFKTYFIFDCLSSLILFLTQNVEGTFTVTFNALLLLELKRKVKKERSRRKEEGNIARKSQWIEIWKIHKMLRPSLCPSQRAKKSWNLSRSCPPSLNTLFHSLALHWKEIFCQQTSFAFWYWNGFTISWIKQSSCLFLLSTFIKCWKEWKIGFLHLNLLILFWFNEWLNLSQELLIHQIFSFNPIQLNEELKSSKYSRSAV